ncbi:hypothetical protein [Lyngbya sp. CCY1209]|uniref:hypothetical protein n=1 Tax=Lyngbya sp. CCY1209 TaxID=2886103 RepID=UPI002D207736|nr:hypothetical protein [Lyngbya sp. CCY1209]MEB3884059.1 hypothetical protein [Lyngbya sp. CCY1209]
MNSNQQQSTVEQTEAILAIQNVAGLLAGSVEELGCEVDTLTFTQWNLIKETAAQLEDTLAILKEIAADADKRP